MVKVYQNAEGQKIYPCNFCAKEFKKPYELGRHLRVHTLEKPFKCRICPRAFAVKTALNSHSKIHTAGGRDHLCSVCLKRFSTKALLRTHQKTHLPEDTSNIDVGEPLKITENGMLLQQEKRSFACGLQYITAGSENEILWLFSEQITDQGKKLKKFFTGYI